jgi:hypothetical protein
VQVQGRIVAVQERRFRLLLPDGRVFLLTLGRFATTGERELTALRDARTTVEVHFTGQPHRVGGVAHIVRGASAP